MSSELREFSFTVLSTQGPAWAGVLELLKPSEIVDLCIATGVTLSGRDKLSFLNPLREIFHMIPIVSKSGICVSELGIIGKDVSYLTDSRVKYVSIGLVTSSNALYNELIGYIGKDVAIYPIDNIRPDVDIIPISTPDMTLMQRVERIAVYICAAGGMSVCLPSVNLLLDLVHMTDDIRNFKYVRRYNVTAINLPYMLCSWSSTEADMRSLRTEKGLLALTLTKNRDKSCFECKANLYSNVLVEGHFQAQNSLTEALAASWYLWKIEPTCLRHDTLVNDLIPHIIRT